MNRISTIIFLIIALSPIASYGKIYIDIGMPAASRLKIAVPAFITAKDGAVLSAAQLTSIIGNDLEASGILALVDKSAYADIRPDDVFDLAKIDFKPWVASGSEFLLKGRVLLEGTNISAEYHLYDVTAGTQIITSRISKDIKQLRSLAHHISDDILESLTGERGAFNMRIAFISSATGNKEVYLMDYDGERIEAVTKNGSINGSPSWSSDGATLSYLSYKSGIPEIYLRDIPSGSEKKVHIKDGSVLGAAWSPDGKHLAVVISKEGNSDIYALSRDDGSLTRLTDSWGLDVSPSWSPDAKEIAFVSDRGGNPQIYVMESSGKNVRRLTYEGKYNAFPSWSPKSGRIVFAGMNNGAFDIFTMQSDGSGLRQLTSGQGTNEHPAWSPDGRFIYFSSKREGAYAIYMMLNDGNAQKRLYSGKGMASSPACSPRPLKGG